MENVLTQKDDKTFVETIVKKFEIARKTTSTKGKEIFETMVRPKLVKYFEKLKVSNPYLADHPHILSNLMDTIEKTFGAGKTQQTVVEEDVKKND